MENLVIVAVLMTIGYISGTILEKRHLTSLREREKKMLTLPTVMMKRPLDMEHIKELKLVVGSVVISIDYFKKIVATLSNLFGGNIVSYETLVDRARREAILRMKEDAGDAHEIVNIRIETSSISKNANRNIGAVEVLAYGTAVWR